LSAGELRAELESDRLFLPLWTRLDFYFELPPNSELAVDEWTWRGSGDARVEVLVETDERSSRVVANASPDSPSDPVPLTGDRTEIIRLGLRAMPGGSVGGEAGVLLSGAAVRVPREPQAVDPLATTEATAPGRPETPPNLLIYMIDTLRADRLGIYGYESPVSPNIDRFGAEATVFDNAVGQSSWTRASVASVLTGLWPVAHGANRRGDRLSDEALTLGEILQLAGYGTAAVGTNPNVSGPFGFRQGFDHFVMLRSRPRADIVNNLAFEWLDGREDEAPFFLYLHTVEPHDPYSPPEEYRQRFAPDVSPEFARRSKKIMRDLRLGEIEPEPQVIADLLALYDGEIADNDAWFGRLLDGLRERGLYDDTMIIVVSDHGEEFYEHGGWTHGRTLQSESVNVPLIVRFPGQSEGRRVDTPVQHIDILPTVLEALGLEIPSGLEGRSLAAVAQEEAGGEPHDRKIYSYLELDQVAPREKSPISHLTSVVEDEWKLVHDLGSKSPIPKTSLYRWREDVAETEDLSDAYPVLAGYLRTLTAERLLAPEERLEADQAVIDEELEESLRALGYLP
jgi:arylsulfatase A-like enzyme